MSGKFGVKATEEVLKLTKVMALAVLAEVAKDGWQVSDLGAFLKSPDFEAALKPVVTDLGLVPAELTELDLWDDLELGKNVYATVQEIIAALKKLPKK